MEINGKNYVLKYGLRAMFVMEEMTGKPFEVNTLLDTYCFCYACIIANKDNPHLEFEEFIDYCDGHPNIINEFNDFMNGELKKREVITPKKKVGRPKKNNSQ